MSSRMRSNRRLPIELLQFCRGMYFHRLRGYRKLCTGLPEPRPTLTFLNVSKGTLPLGVLRPTQLR